MSFPSLFAILFAAGALRRRRALPRWLPVLAILVAGLFGSTMAQATVYTFNGNPVETCTLSNKVYTCPYPAYLDWDDAVVIGSGYTLKVTTSVTVTYNQGLTMQAGSKLIVTGNLNIKGINPANLKVADNSVIEVGATFSMGDLAQTLSADISANAMSLGTDRITVNGNLTSKTSIAIGSYATINGNISGTVITTNSPVTIKGDVVATTSFTLASGSKVTGSVDTGSLVIESSESMIDGPAYVNTARLEWHGRVTGIITCKNGTAKNKCDCVTNNSGYEAYKTNGPRCEAPAPKAPHHFQVTHDGEGDTCLPEKITVTACANAACTAPHFSGAVSGGLTVTGTPAQADTPFAIAADAGSTVVSVKRFAEGAVTLGVADVAGTTCYRSSSNTNSCGMNFAGGVKLLVDAPDHVAAADNITVALQAVKANDTKTACVAAFENISYPVQYSCNYSKPKTGTLGVALGGQSLACAAFGASASPKSVNTFFGQEGRATPLALKYADAGEVTLNAYVDTQKGMTASGQDNFVTVPASFLLAPAAGTIRAGADFALTITARNAAGATTPNFDNADLNAALGVNHGVTLGVDCHLQGGSKGTVTPASPAFSNGVASVNATWSDVGNIDLSASLSDFLGSGLNAGGTTNTLGAGKCSGKAGPFIPAYYRLALTGTRSWYYSGEPLPLLVSAMNKSGALTVNYNDTLKLSEAVTLAANDNTGAAFAPAPGTLSIPTVAAASFAGGVAAAKPAYTFTVWPSAPTQIRLRAANGKPAGTDVSSATPASAEEAMPVIRTGRLRLGSRFGGLKTSLSVPVTAEYWTGRSWLLNSDDNHTLIPKTAFAIKPTVSGMTVNASASYTPTLSGGATTLSLSVSAGGPGPVDLAVNLGGTLQDNACINGVAGSGLATTSAAAPWLRPFVTGCSSNLFRDPSGRVTFGVYTPEDRRVIHVREVFN